MGTRYFTPKLFAFLRDLADNNARDWFKANQHVYEEHVREPALAFIADIAGPLAAISPHLAVDSRKVGGSLFRIQRDMRFSPDGAPYKTNTGMQFRHLQGRDVHAPGFYIHLEPRGSFLGAGMWRPPTAAAYRVRAAIDAESDAWRTAVHSPQFADAFELDGDSLVRSPKGYSDDHPLVEDLKRKDFVASRRLSQAQVTSEHFLDDVVADFRRTSPFMAFLCGAVGVPF